MLRFGFAIQLAETQHKSWQPPILCWATLFALTPVEAVYTVSTIDYDDILLKQDNFLLIYLA